MNKRDVVEVESAFLKFIETATECGFTFSNLQNEIELQHVSDTKHSMNGHIDLRPADYL